MSLQTRIIQIQGMTCQNCVKSVHNTVSTLKGVVSIDVNKEMHNAIIGYQDDVVTLENIAQAIEDAGFDAKIPAND